MSTTPAAWKAEQREILRASFAPAFVKYSELVNKIHEPDDWRKYLEFIARQTGLEEPTAKGSAHDGLATVNINIGAFRGTALPMNAVGIARELLTPSDEGVVEVQEVAPKPEKVPYYDPGLAAILAEDVIDADPPAREVSQSADDIKAELMAMFS